MRPLQYGVSQASAAPDRPEGEGMRKTSQALCMTAIAALALLSGCQGGTPQKPSPTGPVGVTELGTLQYTGREAFQKLYATAHMWAGDARPFRLQSDLTKDTTGKDGKAAIWRAGFASATRRNIKTFVWSGSHSEDAPSFGVTQGTEDTYNPGNSSTQVFDINYLKVDSDKAFAEAQKHGGEKILKQKPDQPVFYTLEWFPRQSKLLWHVVYGTNVPDAKLNVAVDGTTGAFVRVEK